MHAWPRAALAVPQDVQALQIYCSRGGLLPPPAKISRLSEVFVARALRKPFRPAGPPPTTTSTHWSRVTCESQPAEFTSSALVLLTKTYLLWLNLDVHFVLVAIEISFKTNA